MVRRQVKTSLRGTASRLISDLQGRIATRRETVLLSVLETTAVGAKGTEMEICKKLSLLLTADIALS